MNRTSIPNIITIFRLLLAVPLVISLLDRSYQTALGILMIAALSDAVDGYLARHYNWLTRLGAILDPLSDKVLLVSSFITLGVMGDLPVWLVAMVLVRDIVIVSGAVAYQMNFGYVAMTPTFISKTNTLFQIVLLLAVILANGLYPLSAVAIDSLIYVTAFTTGYSGINYVWVWSHRALKNRRGKDNE